MNGTTGIFWAQCVGWYISKARYGDNDDWDVNQQKLSLASIKNIYYTPVAIDMIDDRNQYLEVNNRPNDRVE